MAYNLSRNSRVFVTTNLNAAGDIQTTGFTANNCWELTVQDGFSFTQNTSQSTIQINEAGNSPIRGQRAFNTALEPVDISFATYIRPKNTAGTTTADEKVLWNALFGYVGVEGSTYMESGSVTTNTPLTITGATTPTRATTLSGTVTLTGCTIGGVATAGTDPKTAPVLNVIYNIKNVTATGGSLWEGPAKLKSFSGNTAVFEYLTPPVASATTSLGASIANAKIDRAAWVNLPAHAGRTTATGLVSTGASNRNQLLPIGFVFIVDSVTYLIHNCAMDGATIDFGLDAIAMVSWTAKGTRIEKAATQVTAATGTFGGGFTGTYQTPLANDAGAYITNKLSTMTLVSKLFGTDASAGTSYNIVLTGGSLQIANNISYVTPNNLGAVNKPIGYFTGTRAISGTVNAYLRTGTTGDAGDLLNTMLTNISSSAETKYKLQVEVGGASNPNRIEFDIPGAVIGVPSVDVQDVVSTAITFNAQGTTNDMAAQTYDVENTNDLTVRYYANV